MKVRVEQGPKGKKSSAYAVGWPGLERGGKTNEIAVQRLDEYRDRYLPVARIARLGKVFQAEPAIEVVETYTGTGSTDFWGISFASAPDEINLPYEQEVFDRDVRLLKACWTFFDDVAGRVSAELRKGPRGGGRDRDHIIRHVLFNEADWASGIGVDVDQDALVELPARQEYREQYVNALREYHAEGKMAKKWTLQFLIRHSAYHTLDHAWEMEDKDLSSEG